MRSAAPSAGIDGSFHAAGGGAAPTDFLRLAVASIAGHILSGLPIARLAAAHPGISIDVIVPDADIAIVRHGFDAVVRLGEVVGPDMIALPIDGEVREVAAASPNDLARHGCS